MRRLLLGLVSVVLFGGCATTTPIQQGPPPYAPTTLERKIVERDERVVPADKATVPHNFQTSGIEASVVPSVLNGSALAPPDDPTVLGWWGSKVGAKQGVTLLIGHTVHTGGGALDDLEGVAVGTAVKVSGVSYTVTRNQIISKAELARRAPHLFSQTGSHRLVVVTCEDYDPVTGHYASNVVMVAKP